MKEIQYQMKYINKLANTAKDLLHDAYRDSSTIVFKAPTGSGKTYMVSQTLTQMVKDNPEMAFAFIWISVNNLHEQSLNSLSRYFEDEQLLECITNNDLNDNTIEQNQIMFINWESINKENSLFRVENEQNWNLQSVVENTKDIGNTIVLLIDESHRNASTDKSKELIDIISPKLIIEVTATPKNTLGALIDIPLGEVIAEGMIKKEVRINDEKPSSIKSNEDILKMALRKRTQLQTAYKHLGKDINPLLLIQIPNKRGNDVINPEEEIMGFLSEQGLTVQNGRIALWLSEDHRNKEEVELNSSPVEVLIFKEAIALGWDCPRASILFLQREWNNERYEFNIQTLGRIMRMPEQTHYDDKPELNYGYVYTASDNFTIVEDLAKDYVSQQRLTIDHNIYNSRPKLFSEHIRRKRELTRLSGDFKTVFNQAAKEYDLKNKINLDVTQISKTIKLGATVSELDKGGEQEVQFKDKKQITKSKAEIQSSYDGLIRKMAAPYEIARSQNILKTSIRSWFKSETGISDDDVIQRIVMSGSQNNNSHFKQVIEDAKELYKNLPTKKDEIITNTNWEVPISVDIFSDCEEIKPSAKSILKQEDAGCFIAKKDKNGKSELSTPEKEFIQEMEQSDDYLQWWYKNGISESKYFCIAYQKEDGFHYGFFPDFILKTKKETIIVEIKDNKDFKADNYYKLRAGKKYLERVESEEKVRFYILSPNCYYDFFKKLNDMDLDDFESKYEHNLMKFIQSQQLQIKAKIDNDEKLTKVEEEYKELFSEYEKSVSELDDEKLKRELLELELDEARTIIEQYKNNLDILSVVSKSQKQTFEKLDIVKPFNICILGEVSDQSQIRHELNSYFAKIGVGTTEWDVNFVNNTKLENTNIYKSLQKGQTKYNIIVIGQIYHHSGKGNQKANIISELSNEKYIPYIVCSSPKELLTPDRLIEKLHEYLQNNYVYHS
ncbi:MAG TPA: DEAD/DEAH box helicase family protein [Candidatus Avirikenella pullistercoris]|nr:DEAD/DEAH box helicase family protein [Candidatus Avirikenella pullistercoris]